MASSISGAGSAIAGRPAVRIAANALGQLASEAKDAAPDTALSQVTCCRRSPIREDHLRRSELSCPRCRSRRCSAREPQVFLRLVNTLVAHNQPMVRPRISGDFDYEGELAVVIGKPGRHIAKQDGLSHVCGYACFNDGSIRDIQFKHSVSAGKNFSCNTAALGLDRHRGRDPRPDAAASVTRLNGMEVQHTGMDDLYLLHPTLISYCSTGRRSWLAM